MGIAKKSFSFKLNATKVVNLIKNLKEKNHDRHRAFVCAADNHDHAVYAGSVYYRGYAKALEDVRRQLHSALEGLS